MQGSEILQPFLAMMVLTMVVWILMYAKRISYLTSHSVHPQKLTTPDKVAAVIPEETQWPAYNLRNLLELPILFYALCLYLYATGSADSVYLWAAWAFVALRALHSVIHCSTNIVMRRFKVYMASSLVLWFMLLRASFELFSGAV